MHEFILNSPVGKLKIVATNNALVRLNFTGEEAPTKSSEGQPEIIKEAILQLNEYFVGDRTVFELPLAPEGTDFQLEVWNLLKEIPYGATTTYSKLSHNLGNPKAVRAIGKANGQNPIPIIIPCHRVIGANDTLVGYAGGIEIKRRLLQHEGALLL